MESHEFFPEGDFKGTKYITYTKNLLLLIRFLTTHIFWDKNVLYAQLYTLPVAGGVPALCFTILFLLFAFFCRFFLMKGFFTVYGILYTS